MHRYILGINWSLNCFCSQRIIRSQNPLSIQQNSIETSQILSGNISQYFDQIGTELKYSSQTGVNAGDRSSDGVKVMHYEAWY